MEKIMADAGVHISISVVSHGQMEWIQHLLRDLDRICHRFTFEVILTLNLPEVASCSSADFHYPLRVIQNAIPQGFASNHNQAFRNARGLYFCVLNPDIRLQMDPFPALLSCLSDDDVGVAAPSVWNPVGVLEDSFRRFPNPAIILSKALGYRSGADYELGSETVYPDWAGGMFLLFSTSVFRSIQGFDTRYFLYYEDVDICARLRLAGYRVAVSPYAKVMHAAQRASHVRWQYRRWHLASMARFFLSSAFFRNWWRSRAQARVGSRP